MLQRIAHFDRRIAQPLTVSSRPIFAVESNGESFVTESSSQGSDVIEMVDISSGMRELCCSLSNSMSAFDEVVYSKNTALFYHSTGNVVAVVDLKLGTTIGTQALPIKSSQRIVSVAASSFKEGMFFISVSGDFVVYVVSRQNDSDELYVNKVRLKSCVIKSPRASISHVRCHPDFPFLFVAVSEGFIQVWNYQGMCTSSNAGLSSAANLGPGDDRSDEGDDEGDISAESVSTNKLEKDSGPYICTAVLLHPENVDDPFSAKKKTYTVTSISVNSHFVAVVWDDALTVVFYSSQLALAPVKGKSIRCCSPAGQFTAPANAILGAVVAHTSVPVILQICLIKGDGVGLAVYILALHLGFQDLAISDFSYISDGVDFDNIHVSHSSGNIILTVARERQSVCSACIFRISQQWLLSTGYCNPVMTRIPTPTRSFIEGDLPAGRSGSKNWPLSLSLHPSYDLCEELSVPVDINYTICSMNRPGETDLPFSVVSSFAAVSSSNNTSAWSNVPPELRAVVPSRFFPNNIKLNFNFITGSSVPIPENLAPWEAVILGHSLTRKSVDWETDGIQSQLNTEALICIIQTISNSGPISMYVRGLDADFWPGFVGTVPLKTSSESKNSGLLYISPQRNKLFWVISKSSKVDDPRLNLDSNFTVDLIQHVCKIWTALPGLPNIVIVLATASDAADYLQEYLLATEPGKLNFDDSSNRKLPILQGETVLDVLWQPLSSYSVHCEEQCTEYEDKGCNKTSSTISPCNIGSLRLAQRNYFIGILTNKRVLITTETLQIVSSVSFTFKCKSYCPDLVTSISWIGASLVYSTISGQVKYLICPSKLSTDSSLKHVKYLNMIRAAGETISMSPYLSSHEQHNDILCSIPLHHCRNMSLKIICCLPDRIIFSNFRSSAEYFSYLSLFSRPCNPVEPLLRGLLNRNMCFGGHICSYSSDESNSTIRTFEECVKNISICYFGTASDSISSLTSETGAVPSSHISGKLSTSILLSTISEAAASFSGGTPSATNLNFYNFPRCRWVPSSIKFLASLSNRTYKEACFDIFNENPRLHEILRGENVSSSNALIRRDSLQAEQVLSAACLLIALGCKEEACRLIDVIGHDCFLAFSLATKSKTDDQELASFVSSIADKNYFLQESMKPSAPVALYPQRIQIRSIANFVRRFGIVKGKQLPSDVSTDPGITSFFNIEALETARKAHMLRRGGGLGPVSNFDILSMDSIEDWIGKVKLETVSNGSTTATKVRFGAPLLSRKETTPASKTDDKNYPVTWIEDVGAGNERDKVVGYWRFSDSVSSSDPDFFSYTAVDCSGRPPPPATLNFIDLSKFCTVLELVADKSIDLEPILFVNIEPSTSAVDPGEDPDKVKSVNDLIFPLQDEGFRSPAIRAGLRSVVHRGSALDIGVYHADAERRKMTLEMMVNRFEDNSSKKSGGQGGNKAFKQYFAMRMLGNPSGNFDSRSLMWSFYVDVDSSLVFVVGNVENASPSCVRSPAGVFKACGTWIHVSLTMEASSGSYPTLLSESFATKIQILVNGEPIASGEVMFPGITESDLKTTTMYVGMNLSGWRFCELRLWADIRSTSEIQNNLENYLPHASKRKRLQFNIKGDKRLFRSVAVTTSAEAGAFLKSPLSSMTGLSASGSSDIPVAGGALAARKARQSMAVSQRAPPPIPTLPPMDTSDSASLSSPPGLPSHLPPPPPSKPPPPPPNNVLHTTRIGSLEGLDITLKDMMRCLRRRPLPLIAFRDTFIVVQKRTESSRVLGAISIKYPSTENPGGVKRSSLQISSESAISSPSLPVIAILSEDLKMIYVLDTQSRKRILQQAMPFPLVFWSFTDASTIHLVTSHAFFQWKIASPGAPSATPPEKLFDRQDIASPTRWTERKVSDVQTNSRCAILSTSPRITEAGLPMAQEESDSGAIVTLYVAEIKKCVSVRALSSSFLKFGQDGNREALAFIYVDESSSIDLMVIPFEGFMSWVLENELSTVQDATRILAEVKGSKNMSLCPASLNAIQSSPRNINVLVSPVYIFYSSSILQVLLRSGLYFAFSISIIDDSNEFVSITKCKKLTEKSANVFSDPELYILSAGLFHSNDSTVELKSWISILTNDGTIDSVLTIL